MTIGSNGKWLPMCATLWFGGLLLVVTAMLSPASAQTYGTCTVASGSIDVGTPSSLLLATAAEQGSGASGLSCTTVLTLITTAHVKVRVESSSTFTLTRVGGGGAIPFTLSTTAGGGAMPVGTDIDLSSSGFLALLSQSGTGLPFFLRTSPTAALRAGIYKGTINLTWYFSVCTAGVGSLCVFSNSPGASTNILTGNVTWGTGVAATLDITLEVTNDCAIGAPNLTFASAPFAASFGEVTGTILIWCSADAAYTVGLSDGANFSDGSRRMRDGVTSNYLRYEIYQAPGSSTRWGAAPGARRDSATANTNPGVYDGTVQQGFTYGARIDPTQPTPPQGTYTDTIQVDVQF